MTRFEVHGNQGIITEDEGTLVTDRTSLATCTAVFKIRKDRWTQLPTINAAHPIFTFIGMERRELSFQGPWAIARCSYAGIDSSKPPGGDGGDDDIGTEPVFDLSVGLSDEPIATHPDFATAIGGTPMAPLNGAMFQNVNDNRITNGYTPEASNEGFIFYAFSATLAGGVKNTFHGIESYLNAGQLTWRKTQNLRYQASSVTAVGSIQNPSGPAPSLGGDRNWLFMGLSSTRRGMAYQTSWEWRASGRNKWKPEIYG